VIDAAFMGRGLGGGCRIPSRRGLRLQSKFIIPRLCRCKLQITWPVPEEEQQRRKAKSRERGCLHAVTRAIVRAVPVRAARAAETLSTSALVAHHPLPPPTGTLKVQLEASTSY
jgi:hypothetical protein